MLLIERHNMSPHGLHFRVRMHHPVWMGSAEMDERELRHRIEAGIEAADELKRRFAQLEREESRERPKLRLIKGGAIGVVVLAGVEWLRGYRRAALGVLVTTAAASGLVYVMPAIPDPPNAEIPPPSRQVTQQPRPPTPAGSVAPRPTPRSAPPITVKEETSPPRTSPPRTKPSVSPVTVTPTKPSATATVGSILETPLPAVAPTQALPSVAATQQPDCSLLSVHPLGVCLKVLGTR